MGTLVEYEQNMVYYTIFLELFDIFNEIYKLDIVCWQFVSIYIQTRKFTMFKKILIKITSNWFLGIKSFI